MACYRPLKGYRSPFPNQNGKFGFIFDKSGVAVIPCGRCIGCRIERSRMWAVRCLHEASLYENNCFITLTYSEDHVPSHGALDKTALQKFFKRLRKRCGSRFRYYACGEYGDQLGRPHFHACIFGWDFSDKVLWSTRDGVRLYTSDFLSDLWTYGFSTVGDVTFESAAYVARYCMKKIVGDRAESHYTRLVPETGELVSIPSEFTVMSRRPGIGKPWLDRYQSDVYPDDFVVVNGVRMKVPRFYDIQLEKFEPVLHGEIKARRYDRAVSVRSDCTPERLKVREVVTLSKLSRLKRSDI